MKGADFRALGAGHPRLAAHANGVQPAWLWAADGARILWANPAGLDVFGLRNDGELSEKIFGPADPQRRQVAQLIGRLNTDGAVRMERLRGFGAAPGMLATCSCARIDLPDGHRGVLIVSDARVARKKAMPEPDVSIAAAMAVEAVAETPAPAHTAAPFADYETPAQSNEAPAEFALFDPFTEDDAAVAATESEATSEPGDPDLLDVLQFEPPHVEPAQTATTAAAELHAPRLESPPPPHGAPEEAPPHSELPQPARAEEITEAALQQPTTVLDQAVETHEHILLEPPVQAPPDAARESSDNVLPFRPTAETKIPVLTPVENSAFNELARQLSARLDNGGTGEANAATESTEIIIEPETEAVAPASDRPDWLAPPEPPARGTSRRDRVLLDLLPAGVLIYRLDRLLYANPAFLKRIGYASLHALEEAGGLDALYVEPGVSTSSSTSETGTPVTITASHAGETASEPDATAARLHTITWDDDAALALICSEGPVDAAPVPVPMPALAPEQAPEPAGELPVPAAGEADAEELGAILDTTAEGIVMFDEEGNITACNRSAEALFGYDGGEFVTRNLADLFAPESQHGVFEYFAGVKSAGIGSLLDHGRETLGRVRSGGFVPLSVTIGRTRADGPNFFAVFRDLSQSRKSESELQQARRLTESAASAKSDMMARISHELRAPLNAIIGFAEVMITERFGSLGNDRYAEYMKDIRASGQRVVSFLDDMVDLSRVETGKLDLAFISQNLNEMVESCVAVMQPKANRERIIIRTSLAHTLPPVVADTRALRQIAMNLIGNSIHLAKAGGQVIVSTALSDFGEVVLRVRDTGQAMNDNEVAAALEPFRTREPGDRTSDVSAVSLSLTKALVEANRAQFHIRPGPHTGTLVEVVFTRAGAGA